MNLENLLFFHNFNREKNEIKLYEQTKNVLRANVGVRVCVCVSSIFIAETNMNSVDRHFISHRAGHIDTGINFHIYCIFMEMI